MSTEAGDNPGGAMAGGRKLNLERWRRVEELRAAGLSLPAIGRRLGCTHQAVASVLGNIRTTRERVRSVACAGCGEPIISAGCSASWATPNCSRWRS